MLAATGLERTTFQRAQFRHVPDAVIAGEEQAVPRGQRAGGGGGAHELPVHIELEVVGTPGGVIGEGQVAPNIIRYRGAGIQRTIPPVVLISTAARRWPPL